MAEKLEISEDDLSCPICVEVFREPVSLSCQHSFCRECLKCIVQKDTQNKFGDIEISGEPNHVITCPVCRSLTDLGIKDVEELPVELTLANRAEELRGQQTVDDAIPRCSVCEDEGNKPAVNFCVTCSLFYCQICVDVMHPMRGGLKRHKRMTVDEYLSQQKLTGTTGTTDDAIETSDQCPDHTQQVVVFCGSCQALLCKQCFSDHDGHALHDIATVYRKSLTMLEEKTKALEQLKVKVEGMLAELAELQADVEEKKSLHVAEIDSFFKEAIQAVNAWRKDCLEAVGKRHRNWLFACAQATRGFKLQIEEIEGLIQTSKEQLCGSESGSVVTQCELEARINDLSASVQDNLQRHTYFKRKWREEVNADPVIPRYPFVGESGISTPKLTFLVPLDDCVDISENGTVLVSIQNVIQRYAMAFTDASLQTGKHYWELDVTFTGKTTRSEQRQIYSAGVVIDAPKGWYVGDRKQSWGVIVDYRDKRYMLRWIESNGSSCTYPLPVFPGSVAERGTVRHGFYLDCEQGALTILDCTYNRVLSTFWSLNTSLPLTPVVSLYNSGDPDVSVRLRKGNLYSLFKVKPELLKH